MNIVCNPPTVFLALTASVDVAATALAALATFAATVITAAAPAAKDIAAALAALAPATAAPSPAAALRAQAAPALLVINDYFEFESRIIFTSHTLAALSALAATLAPAVVALVALVALAVLAALASNPSHSAGPSRVLGLGFSAASPSAAAAAPTHSPPVHPASPLVINNDIEFQSRIIFTAYISNH